MDAIQSTRKIDKLVRDCQEECQPFINEMVRIQNINMRPMSIVLGSGEIEYGPYAPEVQKCLDELQKMIDSIVNRYKEITK